MRKGDTGGLCSGWHIDNAQLLYHRNRFLILWIRQLLEVLPLRQSRIKGYGGPGQFSLEGPYDVFHDVIVCKICFR